MMLNVNKVKYLAQLIDDFGYCTARLQVFSHAHPLHRRWFEERKNLFDEIIMLLTLDANESECLHPERKLEEYLPYIKQTKVFRQHTGWEL